MRGGSGTVVRMGLLALMWGSSFLWIKMALGGFSPIQITAIRTVLGAVVLLVLCYSSGQRMPRGRRLWLDMVIVALFGNAVPFTLFAMSERSIDSGLAGVLNATTPLWATAIGIAIRTERDLRFVRVGGLLLGFAGTVVIFAPWEAGGFASWGALLSLLAAISYAISFTYIGKRISGRGVAPTALSAMQLTSAVGLTWVVVPFAGIEAVHPSWPSIIAVTLLGVFSTGFAFALNHRLIADEGATNASVTGYLLPIVSVLLGAITLHEPITLRVLAGMVVVLIGVGMTRLHRRAPSPVLTDEDAAAATRPA
ncbi:DMT family transporter [Labedaea rhizosphaerae]|uniref:DMT family transporter n=1 Tax=Labedaea rhizosphaerae TaxID=598644 RepID=UPI001FB674A6|nr:DMT family transporter [Labedaea rhizosphaerae]